jgi:DegV family protein with EDD domain
MDKVAIVTDSAAGIPPEIARDLGIEIIPMQIVKDDVAYTIDRDITAGEVYSAMREGRILKTSQPLVPHITESYERCLKRAEKVLSIHVGSKLTSTVATCQMAADMLEPGRISVIDSSSLTIMYGLPCIYAARNARSGGDLASALAAARAGISRAKGWLAVPSLKFLAQSGRVSKVLSTLGTLLSIKVILKMGEGEVILADKYRSTSAALEKLCDNAVMACQNGVESISFVHADNLDEARRLGEAVLSILDCDDVIYTDIGPTVGVHTGPGAVGVAVFPK